MATPGPVGAAGRLLIARGLIALRERAGLTQNQVAAAAGCGKATVGRYEDWHERSRVKWATVRSITEACQATPTERDALVDLARAQGEGWWVGRRGVPELLDPLLSFEALAEYEHVYASSLIHGLCQTRAYAHAIHQAQLMRASHDEIAHAVDARMMRQEAAFAREDWHLWVVLDEAALHRVVGSRAVMAEQMAHLIELARRPGVDIQVLPFGSGAHAAGAGTPFVSLGRDDLARPLNTVAVVYLEMHDRGIYLDDPEDAANYRRIFDYLRSQAPDTSSSIDVLAQARQDYIS